MTDTGDSLPAAHGSASESPTHGSALRRGPTTGIGFVGLVLLTGLPAMAIDIYTPSLPAVADQLDATASAVQLTISGFMIGMAVGQLLSGPLSDSLGRRRLLLIGEAVCLAATVGCALAPTIELLILARAFQGLSGAFGVAIARAIVVDVTTGARTSRLIATLMAIVGIAPISAPLIGSLTAAIAGWRSAFWLLAAVLVVALVIVVARIPETLPPARRRPATVRGVARSVATILSRRRYVGYLLTYALAFGAFFAYIAAAPFILQVQHGFSAVEYGLIFSSGALLMVASVTTAGRLAGRIDPHKILAVGLAGLLLASGILLVGAFTGLSLWIFLVGVAVLACGMGQVLPSGTTLALEQGRDLGGSASAVLGFSQFTVGAVVAPLVGIAGASDPRPFGIVMITGAVLAVIAFVVLARRRQ